jgi:hypothetical protein
MATRERDDDERLGDVGQLFVVEIFRQGDSPMNQILVPPLEVCHAGLNLTFPAGSHPDVSTFNFQLHAASCCSLGLFGLSGLIGLFGLSGFCWLNETNQMNQINQINNTNQIDQISLLLVDISKRCARLERRFGVRG